MSVLEKTSVRITKEEKEFLKRNNKNVSGVFREFLEYYISKSGEVHWKK